MWPTRTWLVPLGQAQNLCTGAQCGGVTANLLVSTDPLPQAVSATHAACIAGSLQWARVTFGHGKNYSAMDWSNGAVTFSPVSCG